MVENVQFAKPKLMKSKLGVTETNIVQNIFVKFVFPNYGFDFSKIKVRKIYLFKHDSGQHYKLFLVLSKQINGHA